MTNLAGNYIRCGVATAFALSAAQFLMAAHAWAADYAIGAIHITHPWARATPKGASTGAAYMTIANDGTTPDRVTCAASNASAKCQIHSMTMKGGVMRMRPVVGGLEIKPGQTVTLNPFGLHVMLIDLKHPLKKGNVVKATLKFEKAGTVEIAYPIAGIGATAAPGAPASGAGTMAPGHGTTNMNKD